MPSLARRNPMSPGAAAAVVGAGALLLVGGVVAVAYASSKPAPSPQPSGFLAPVTNPVSVKQYQMILADALARGVKVPGPSGSPLTSADYAASDVDGNPTNPRWMAVVAAVQRYVDASATPQDLVNLPPDFPAKLRTDGVLDYATAIWIVNS